MRRLLILAAALTVASASSLDAEPHSNRVGKASVAPEVQDRAQAQSRHQAQPQPGQENRGGHFNNSHGDRGPAPQPGPQASTPPDRAGRGNWRGNWQGHGGAPASQATIRSPEPANRGNWRGRNDRDHDFNRDGRTGYRPNYRQGASYGGPRHDFSGFRDYHRNYHVTRRFNVPYYRRPAGWYARRWTFGEYLPAAFWARDYWLMDFQAYDLPPPPYGAVWVRVGDDALLVDEDSGEVITVAYGVFY